MSLWGFLTGLIIGIVPIMVFFRYVRGKFLFFTNPYLKGVAAGFLLWMIINIFFWVEAQFNMFGLLRGDEGYSTMYIITTSLQGFLTAGLLAAFAANKLWGNKTPKT